MPIRLLSGGRCEDADRYITLEVRGEGPAGGSGEASRVLSQEHSSGAETPRVGSLKAVVTNW